MRGFRSKKWSKEVRKFSIVRIIFLFFGVLFFAWFALPLAFSISLNPGNATGLCVSALLFALGVFLPQVCGICKKWRAHKILCWIYRGIVCGISLIALLVVVESVCMLVAANKKPADGATVVVLGCRVYGERASLSMVERLEAAYDYLLEHPEANCILSGGKGQGESITEAECMYRYLVNLGIAPERLYKEEASATTRENLLFSKQLMEEQGLNPVIAIATSEYHEYRAGRIAAKLGMEYAAIQGKTAFWLFPTYYVRELYGILYEWFF